MRKAAEAATNAAQDAPEVIAQHAPAVPASPVRRPAAPAVVERAPIIVHTVDLASLPAVAAKFSSASGGAPVAGFEYYIPALAPSATSAAAAADADRKTADLIEKIEEAIVDVVVAPKQQHLFDVLNAVAAEKADAEKAARLAAEQAALVQQLLQPAQQEDAVIEAPAKTLESTLAFDELAGE